MKPFFQILLTLIPFLCRAQLDDQSSRHLMAARDAEKKQDYAAAAIEYEAILKEQPSLAVIHQSLAVTLHLQNRFPEAIAEFQKALRLDASLWGSDLFLGMDYYKTNRFSDATGPLQKSMALNARMAEPDARYWLALTSMALDQPDDAVSNLNRDLELKPGDPDVLYYLTKAYDQTSDAAFQKIGKLEPESGAVHFLQAERFLDENRRDLAGLQFSAAVELRPDFEGWLDLPVSHTDATLVRDPQDAAVAAAWTKLKADSSAHPQLATALSLLRERRFRDAEEAMNEAAKTIHEPILVILRLRTSVEAGDGDKIKERINEYARAKPATTDALLILGRYSKQQAFNTLQKLTQTSPNFYGLHELLGHRHEEKTEFETAIQEYQLALQQRPDLAGIRYAIGNVYRKMKRYDEAEKWLSDELAANPYHGLAHFRLGTIYTEEAKPQAAIPHLLQALEAHPHLVDAQLDLGRAYIADGKYEQAVTQLRQVSHLEPSNDRVHYLLSVAYSKEGKRSDAQTEMAEYQRLTRDRLRRTQQDIRDLSDSLDR